MEITIDVQKISSQVAEELIRTLGPLFSRTKEDEVFGVKEAAAYLKTSPKWIYTHQHLMPHVKLEGLLRFRKSDIDKLIAKKIIVPQP